MSLTPPQRQLEKQIRKERPGLLDGLPGDRKRALLELLETKIPPGTGGMVITQQTRLTTSPVPPAELLLGYNAAFPDGANRLFALVEAQSAHRQTLEDKITTGQLALTVAVRRSPSFWRRFSVIGLVVALYGHTAEAVTIFGTTVLGLAAAFIAGQVNQKRNLDRKAPK